MLAKVNSDEWWVVVVVVVVGLCGREALIFS